MQQLQGGREQLLFRFVRVVGSSWRWGEGIWEATASSLPVWHNQEHIQDAILHQEWYDSASYVTSNTKV